MRRIVVTLALLSFSAATFAQVTSSSLLKEMIELERLTRRPDPFFKTSQASSYDRGSIGPGQPGWFDNGDAGRFIRTETNEGRKEYVMADLEGPGAVVRIWSANPTGTIRFYFDGEDKPRVEGSTVDLLVGRFEYLKPPFSYWALRGTNLYFPIPYEKSLKVTLENSDSTHPSMYYHVGFRTYEPGTKVRSFEMDGVDLDEMARVGNVLQNPDGRKVPSRSETASHAFDLQAGNKHTVEINKRGAAITELVFKPDMPTVPFAVKRWSDPRHPHHILRGLRMEISFDGKTTVRVPVADFFGAPPFGTSYKSYAFSIREDGAMVCRFWMPFRENVRITINNTNSIRVRGDIELIVSPYKWDDTSRYFHSQWVADRGNTMPRRDFTYLDVKGEGHFVGSTLYIGNHAIGWWGEGDEKIWVDGETFPSTFGTGTEDYYGYAWSDPRTYDDIPYHTQPVTGKPGNQGHIANNRWHVLDPITFNRSLKFDMEIWHWQETPATFAATSYWYATMDSTSPVELNESLLNIEEILAPAPVEGAIEGENMKVLNYSGGATEKQGGFSDLSNGQQLWWIDGEIGDTITMEFNVEKAGTYKISGSFCHAPDYGIHTVTINGEVAGDFDFYNGGLSWKKHELGTFELKQGKSTLIFTIKGANEKSAPKRHMLGLDYILLEKS